MIYLAHTATVQILNLTAGVLWECLDGESELGDILADIADVYGIDTDTVEASSLPVITAWLEDGLVWSQASAPEHPSPQQAEVPARRRHLMEPPNA